MPTKPTKKSKPETESDTPEPQEPQKPQWRWPENKERRNLEVVLRPDERLAIAEENARLGSEVDQLEDEKKASASRYKAKIEEVQSRIRLNNTYVASGRRDKEVDCVWIYEVAGFDSEGKPIEHADKKTLVRSDTGEAVEVRDIAETERQAALPLDDEQDAPPPDDSEE